MTEITHAYDWSGRTVVASDGEKIGKIDDLYLDQQSDRPEWASVHTGLFGSKRSFVPLAGATPQGEDVRVPVFKDQVKSAPGIEPDGELSEQEEMALFEHYGMRYSEQGTVTASDEPPTGAAGNASGRDVSGPSTDDAMTRSEEELRVGTASRERGRVRLRKYVVTEEVQQTVPVRREEVRVEREPITDANIDRATDGPAISDEEHEVVLHEEEVVTEKRAVPKERIRLEKDTVTDEQQVSDEVRKERIDVDTGRD
jgi:uncharacterized protein (TIGR02271 family)